MVLGMNVPDMNVEEMQYIILNLMCIISLSYCTTCVLKFHVLQ